MKNIFKISVLVLAVVLVTGCGSKGKVLTCTADQKSDGIKMSETIKLTFESDKVTKYESVQKATLGKEYKDSIKLMAKSAEAQYEDIAKEKGVSYKVNTKGSVITATLSVDLTKASDKVKEGLSIENIGKYDEAKKAATEAGFKCK